LRRSWRCSRSNRPAAVAALGILSAGRHAHPDLFLHASEAQPVRPPLGVFAHSDFRGGSLFDRLGVSAALAAAGTPFTVFPMMIAFGILWASG